MFNVFNRYLVLLLAGVIMVSSGAYAGERYGNQREMIPPGSE
jgi:hypothetical protein